MEVVIGSKCYLPVFLNLHMDDTLVAERNLGNCLRYRRKILLREGKDHEIEFGAERSSFQNSILFMGDTFDMH